MAKVSLENLRRMVNLNNLPRSGNAPAQMAQESGADLRCYAVYGITLLTDLELTLPAKGGGFVR